MHPHDIDGLDRQQRLGRHQKRMPCAVDSGPSPHPGSQRDGAQFGAAGVDIDAHDLEILHATKLDRVRGGVVQEGERLLDLTAPDGLGQHIDGPFEPASPGQPHDPTAHPSTLYVILIARLHRSRGRAGAQIRADASASSPARRWGRDSGAPVRLCIRPKRSGRRGLASCSPYRKPA